MRHEDYDKSRSGKSLSTVYWVIAARTSTIAALSVHRPSCQTTIATMRRRGKRSTERAVQSNVTGVLNRLKQTDSTTCRMTLDPT